MRNRSEGWQFAKKDGHQNEQDFGEKLRRRPELAAKIYEYVFETTPSSELEISVDGNMRVEGFDGLPTTSKCDLRLKPSNGGRAANLSLKKSEGGQAWLVSPSRFLEILEFHLGTTVDHEAKRALWLFIGGDNLPMSAREVFEKGLSLSKTATPEIAKLEKAQSRLSLNSIAAVDKIGYESLLDLFRSHFELITRLVFGLGASAELDTEAQAIVYNRHDKGVQIFRIEDVMNSDTSTKELIDRGPRNGGTTIWLPFGFLQMHHPQGQNLLQFHHKRTNIENYSIFLTL